MNPTEIRSILAARRIRLTKALGQHFMHDRNGLCRMVEAAALDGRDTVVEIGPGLGALTDHLLPACGRLIAIEKDRRFFEFLRERYREGPRLQLWHRDAGEVVRDAGFDWGKVKLVSNLPYSVASPILVDLALMAQRPERIVVTVQREVARRLRARAGTKSYGLLSLLVQQGYLCSGGFSIPATCFFPVPEIESECVVLLRGPALLKPAEVLPFVKVVKRGFSQRRKMMIKLLKADWPESRIRSAYARLGLSRMVRAEAVSLDQFVCLTRALVGPEAQDPMAEEMLDVVDARDGVIGRETRKRVHELGVRHRAVHILVFHRDGRVFLQKRSRHKDCFPGRWDSSASGHLESGEAYDEGAVRELKEELGISLLEPMERLFKIDSGPETGQEFVWVYRCRNDGPFRLQAAEIEEGRWYTVSEVAAWLKRRPDDFAGGFRLIWRGLETGRSGGQS